MANCEATVSIALSKNLMTANLMNAGSEHKGVSTMPAIIAHAVEAMRFILAER